MSKIRINDLARELEVKSKAILDVLSHVGVTEKKTHSSSLELDEAERVRRHFSGQGTAGAKEDRPSRAGADEIKTKIDLSKISKPGDVLAAIRGKAAAPPTPPLAAKPATATPTVPKPVAKPAPPAPAAAKPAPPEPPRVVASSPPAPTVPAPRVIAPQPRPEVKPPAAAPPPPPAP